VFVLKYVFGIRELDNMYSGVLRPGSLIVIAGHPGSGKTTFAITISYSNALNGLKTLYITLQEDKFKLYSVMKDLGIYLEEVERKGLFKFVNIPISLDIKNSIDWINRLIEEYKPHIVVIDSINALLTGVEEKDQRAWLQNFFYGLLQREKGLTILIAELPYGYDRLKLGSIEFVADAIFVLKHSIEGSTLVRTIEVRKVRGSPSTLVEFPFAILTGVGLKVYPPPYLEEIPIEGEEILVPFRILREKGCHHIHKGFVIYYAQPPDARSRLPYVILLGFLIYHGMKALVITYNYPESMVKTFILGILTRSGLSREICEKFIDENIVVKAINPYAYSISQIYAIELNMVEREINRSKIDFIVFDDVGVISTRGFNYLIHLANQLLIFKKYGLIVLRIGSIVDDFNYRANSLVSDIVFKYHYGMGGEIFGARLHFWRRGMFNPTILSQDEMNSLVEELNEMLREKISLKQ